MHARIQEFVSSCHVLSFSATPTGGGQTCVGPYEARQLPSLPACLPACLLPAPVLSARQSIRPFIHLSRTPKVLARHNRVTRLITHGSQPLATPLTQDFSVPRLRFRSACMHVDVSCLMSLSPEMLYNNNRLFLSLGGTAPASLQCLRPPVPAPPPPASSSSPASFFSNSNAATKFVYVLS